MSSKLKVTLKRGLAGKRQEHRATARALGLRRTGQSVIKEDRPEIRGMIQKIRHLVDFEEISE